MVSGDTPAPIPSQATAHCAELQTATPQALPIATDA